MELKLTIPLDEIRRFCNRWKIDELALFGSVLRDDFDDQSDVDIMINFPPNHSYTLFDMVNMQEELEQLLGRRVDLLTRRGVENSRNTVRKKAVLESAAVVYAA